MKISRTMSLASLAERMGDTATESEALRMRNLLIELNLDGEDTKDVPESTWIDLIEQACDD